jgi:hypothetical protein
MPNSQSNASNSVTKTPKKTPLKAAILNTKAEHPDLTVREIAAINKCDHAHVVRTLKTYGIDHGAVESYTKHRSSIFAGLQSRIIASITKSDIKAASLLQRLSALGILYDKETIERTGSDGSAKPMIQINIGQAQLSAAQHSQRQEDRPTIVDVTNEQSMLLSAGEVGGVDPLKVE